VGKRVRHRELGRREKRSRRKGDSLSNIGLQTIDHWSPPIPEGRPLVKLRSPRSVSLKKRNQRRTEDAQNNCRIKYSFNLLTQEDHE